LLRSSPSKRRPLPACFVGRAHGREIDRHVGFCSALLVSIELPIFAARAVMATLPASASRAGSPHVHQPPLLVRLAQWRVWHHGGAERREAEVVESPEWIDTSVTIPTTRPSAAQHLLK
jgi:hypothetical protein